MWRPRKVSNQSNDSESSDNLMPENNTATISPSRFYIGDLFKAKENASLKERITQLESLMSPEQRELQSIKDEISTAKQELTNKQIESDKLDQTLHELQEHIASSKAELIETDEAVMLQSFGLYEPIYDFSTVDAYKDRLADIRKSQKAMIKAGTAATGSTSWSLNGNKADGERMVKDMQKLLIRAFNSECDEAISKVKFNTFETAQKRITTSRDAISKLGRLMGISIKNNYYMLKIEELRLALEFQIKKQEEKEEQKRIREELREQAKLQKEIEEARRNIKKEQKHYENALSQILKQIESADDNARTALQEKKAEIESHLATLESDMKQVDYREANQKAGYVYIISNIGSFGEDVYKIGMTRRLDPMDRVDELGDASVPFNFDVHAIIFSENAPQLEAALHSAFADRKLNMVNTRREFFHISLEEIEQVVKQNYDKTVEFVKLAPAQQYRESLLLQQQLKQ